MCKVESSRQAEAGVRKRRGKWKRILRQSPAVVDREQLPIQWEVSTKEATKHCCMMRKGGYRIHLRQVGRRSLVLFGPEVTFDRLWFRAVSNPPQRPPQGYSRMEMERAMPALADLFARGFKVCGLV